MSAMFWNLPVSFVYLLAALFPSASMARASTHLSAYAERIGDAAVWQACDLVPGISVTFSPNPSRARANKQGVIAVRTAMTLRVAAGVPAGRYRLLFSSYSSTHAGMNSVVIEYLPTLRVLPNHSIQLPPFTRWRGMDATDGHAALAHSPCTALPVEPGL